MIDLAALKTEIEGDPEGLGYAAPLAAGDVGAVAKLLNTVNRPGLRSVTPKQVRKRLMMAPEGAWGAIRAIAHHGTRPDKSDAPFELVALCWTVLDACEAGAFETFDYQLVDVKGPIDTMLGALVTAGLVSTETRDSILAQATGNRSRAEELFGEGTEIAYPDIALTMKA